MWLVLCSSADASALWAYQGLRQLGVAPLELVTAESLACANRWEHRLRGSKTEIKVTLADGRVIEGSGIRGVVNRIHAPSEVIAQRAVASDRPYAQSETLAFYLSWLHGLPGVVINRPTPFGLCGAWLHPSEWAMRACRAGLRTPIYRQSSGERQDRNCRAFSPQRPSTKRLIALHGEVFGEPVSHGDAMACVRLAADARAEILGVDLDLDNTGHLSFAGAIPSPDLRIGGMPLLQRLTRILTQGARS